MTPTTRHRLLVTIVGIALALALGALAVAAVLYVPDLVREQTEPVQVFDPVRTPEEEKVIQDYKDHVEAVAVEVEALQEDLDALVAGHEAMSPQKFHDEYAALTTKGEPLVEQVKALLPTWQRHKELMGIDERHRVMQRLDVVMDQAERIVVEANAVLKEHGGGQ